MDCQLIRHNPLDRIRQERVGEPPWHHVTPEEYQRLIAAAPSLRWQGMIALAYCCGLRVGEILNLTWRDIDFAEGKLRVAAKRGETDVLDWTPKDKDMRILPVPAPAINLLTKLQLDPSVGQMYLFVLGKGPKAGQRMGRNNVWRDFDTIRRRAGSVTESAACLRPFRAKSCGGAHRAHGLRCAPPVATFLCPSEASSWQSKPNTFGADRPAGSVMHPRPLCGPFPV